MKRRYLLMAGGSAIASALFISCSNSISSSKSSSSQTVDQVKVGVTTVVPKDNNFYS